MSKRTARPVAVISSTAREMPEYLRVALDVCLRLGMIPVMVERPAAGTRDAVEAALSLVDDADIYIGIFGERYGYVPAGYDKSISEMEYDRALERGIPRLVFATRQGRQHRILMDRASSALRRSEGHPQETNEIDTTDENAKLRAFIVQVRQKQFVSEIASTQAFRSLLRDGLTGLFELAEAPKERGESIEHEVYPARKKEISDTNDSINVTVPLSKRRRDLEARDSPRKKGGGDGDAKSAQPKATQMKKKQRDVFRLFVASPRDVQEERSRMPKVVESLNRTLGKLLNIVIELWRWEADAPPGVGEPQALIDPELDAADVVLVIFWNRFGTPASNGVTGTQGEVVRSLKRWSKSRRPQVMIYFCQRPARLERTELEQRLKLLDFRERISSLVLAVDYEEAQEFEWRVRDDLFLTISGLVVKPR